MKEGVERALSDPGHPHHEQTIQVLGRQASELRERWRDPDQKHRDRLAWTLFFQKNYREVVRITRK